MGQRGSDFSFPTINLFLLRIIETIEKSFFFLSFNFVYIPMSIWSKENIMDFSPVN